MTKFYAVAAAALAGTGSVAMAQTALPPTGQVDNQTAAVPVNVEIPSVVSVWTSYAPVNLVLGQSDGTGFDGEARNLSFINNVPASITAQVDGALPTGAGAVNFFIFPETNDVAAAQSASQANAYTPAGALVWTNANMGTPQPFKSLPAVDEDGGVIDLVYAANMPGGVSAPPDDFDLVVTYTIAPTP